MALRAPVISPASTRSTMPSTNISVCTPRSRTPASFSRLQTAFGMPPMPIWTGPVLDLGGDALGHAAVDLGDGGIGHLGHRPGAAVDHVVELARVHRLLLP